MVGVTTVGVTVVGDTGVGVTVTGKGQRASLWCGMLCIFTGLNGPQCMHLSKLVKTHGKV